jgi:hypothetical protein
MRVPKTGSSTLFHTINSQTNSRYYIYPSHLRANVIPAYITAEYDIYAFYRNPYTRFISSWQNTLLVTERSFYKSPIRTIDRVKKLTGNNSLTINDVTPDLIKNISIENIITHIKKEENSRVQDLFVHQKNFHTPNTILFDYDNYESNVKKLLNIIGLDSNVELKKLNASNSQRVYDSITTDEKKMILEYYEPDYEYFASRNIYFE